MTVVEIATFQASDALLANHDLAQAALNITSKAEGFIAAYSGLQVEDQKTAYLAIAWESLEAHKKLIDGPQYAELQQLLKPALAGPLVMHHVEFKVGDYRVAFAAPVTHMIFSKLSPDSNVEELKARNEKLVRGLAATPGVHMPPASGPAMEDPSVFWTAVGWDSVEAHQVIASTDAHQAIIEDIKSVLSESSHAHVKFKKAA